MKRLFDLVVSALLLALIFPFGLFIAFAILIDSKGGAFFRQIRVGKNGSEFRLLKFRTMRQLADQDGQLTVGDRDPRITSTGWFLRKSKLDELPQLINILKGEMSWVGPRPEVPKYVALYNSDQRKVLSVKPGLTDYASLEYIEESELLATAKDPEAVYINEILPNKLELQLKYINTMGFWTDIRLIWQTFTKILQTLLK